MIILGIDPGSIKTGYGIIKYISQKSSLLDYGTINTNKSDNLPKKLFFLFNSIKEISQKWNPNIISVEDVFMKENVNSALVLGQARGALICGAISGSPSISQDSIYELSTREIKKALTTTGGAPKEQVKVMVKMLLNIKDDLEDDASDALAAAIAGAFNSESRLKLKELQ